MTRRQQSTTVEDGRTRKRVLKPVVEKKRRDRINQSLAELRSLLLNHTSDPRLQNPKIEKAEILDFAVEYLQKRTDDSTHTQMKTHPLVVNPHHSEPNAPALFTMESAGFQQCVAQLTSYMHKITPSQRTSLIEGLRRHTESQQPKPDFSLRMMETDAARQQPVDGVCTTERKEDSPKLLFPSHSPFQPHSCSTPCHDYLSPPPLRGFLPPSPHTPPRLLSRHLPLTSPSLPACHLCLPIPPFSVSHPPSHTPAFLPFTAPLHTLHRERGHHQTPPQPCGGLGFDKTDKRLTN